MDVEHFRTTEIFDKVFRNELEKMEFEAWIRSIDNYSFLYTHYLNQNGVISANKNGIKV
jgi:hypothetical protein